MFSYTPAAAPVTVTSIVHTQSAIASPPVNVIVRGAVVVRVPPHWVLVEFATVNPSGKTSVNEMPVRLTE